METRIIPTDLTLRAVDPQIYQALEREKHRQQENIELIASENFVSEAVLEAAGSVFTNKYAGQTKILGSRPLAARGRGKITNLRYRSALTP